MSKEILLEKLEAPNSQSLKLPQNQQLKQNPKNMPSESESIQIIGQEIQKNISSQQINPHLSILINGIAELWQSNPSLARTMERALTNYVREIASSPKT